MSVVPDQRGSSACPDPDRLGVRATFALRLGLIGGLVVAAIGMADHFSTWPLLTSSLGPTAYVFIAHPGSASARSRNAAIGHLVGIAAGLAALAAFGLWSAPSVVRLGHATVAQAGAAGMATALTLALLHLLRSHHGPAASSALLVATGLARPGRPLEGLVTGLAVLILAGPLLAHLPLPPHPERYTDDP